MKEEADAVFENLMTKFNKASARPKQLKEEVTTLQKELAELASTQGVKLALKILNDYYAKALLTVLIEDLQDEIKNEGKAEEETQIEYESEMDKAKTLKGELGAKVVSLDEAIAKRLTHMRTWQKTQRRIWMNLVKAKIKLDCDWISGSLKGRETCTCS